MRAIAMVSVDSSGTRKVAHRSRREAVVRVARRWQTQ
jgi:hypothetical protein